MIFSKQPQRDNIEIMLARKCGFYIRGKQQGLAEDEISMPILMTQTLHEMLVHFADEVRTITKAVYDVEIEQSQKEIEALQAREKVLVEALQKADKFIGDIDFSLDRDYVLYSIEQALANVKGK